MITAIDARTRPGTLTCAIVALAAVAMFETAAAGQQPDVIHITGTVRDFMKSHPDFGVGDTGHVANNIALASADNKPAFMGSGFSVAHQWRNKAGQNIPPHHFHNSGVMMLGSAPDYNQNKAYIDSWSSADGPYGGSNVGPKPPVSIGPIPSPPPPPAGLPNGNGNFPAGSFNIISSSFKTGNLTAGQNSIIQIAADATVTIHVTNAVSIGQNSRIIVPEGSKLILYFGGNFDIAQGGQINLSLPLDPKRCYIYNLGTSTIVFNQDGKICATIVSPNGGVLLKQNDEFFGTIAAKSLEMDTGGALHWDGMPWEICDELIADLEGAAGGGSAGAVTSESTFSQWFNNALGVNASVAHTIALVKQPGGFYQFNDTAFFPIDDMVFGNEGEEHNFNFTFTFSAKFTYRECDDFFFEFYGADDAWVYIAGKLALDLGGVMPLVPQRAELDRLDLVDGEQYTLHFFFAQRNNSISVMNIKTNVPLEPAHVVTMSALYD